MTTTSKSSDRKSTAQTSTDEPISGTTLSSWSRQQKIAMVASFAILALFLAFCACSKQSARPALVGVSGPVPDPPAQAATPAPVNVSTVITPAATEKANKKVKNSPKKRPAEVTYSDANSGVSFLYPRKFSVLSGDSARGDLAAVGDVPMNFVQPGGVAVATVALPAHSYPGTDFASGFFNVSVNRSVSEEQCSHFAFVDTRNADGEPVDAEKVKIGNYDMEMTSEFDASALKQIETQYYHNYASGACYEYSLGLTTEGFPTEGGIQHVDRDAVFAKLEKILATVTVNPAEPAPVTQQTANGVSGGKE